MSRLHNLITYGNSWTYNGLKLHTLVTHTHTHKQAKKGTKFAYIRHDKPIGMHANEQKGGPYFDVKSTIVYEEDGRLRAPEEISTSLYVGATLRGFPGVLSA